MSLVPLLWEELWCCAVFPSISVFLFLSEIWLTQNGNALVMAKRKKKIYGELLKKSNSILPAFVVSILRELILMEGPVLYNPNISNKVIEGLYGTKFVPLNILNSNFLCIEMKGPLPGNIAHLECLVWLLLFHRVSVARR